MKYLIRLLATSSLLVMTLTACGDEKKEQKDESGNSDKGHAVITIDSKTYTLPIQICSEPHTGIYEGEKVTHYSIQASDKEYNIKFSIFGTDDDEGKRSTFLFELNGGFLKNGTSYSKEMPFELFDGKSLHFTGTAVAKKMKSKDKSEKSVEIAVACK